MDKWLEDFWADMLSEEPAKIRAAFARLRDDEERAAILAHLRRMATEDGWATVQRDSARAALAVLAPTPNAEDSAP